MTIEPITFRFIHYGLLAREEDVINLIIFVIIVAFGMIANIAKARSEKKNAEAKTGAEASSDKQTTSPDVRPKTKKPSRLEQILGTIATQESKSAEKDTRSRRKRYYTPGGFAEVLKQDRALEDTLTESHSQAQAKLEIPQDEIALEQPFKPFSELREMDDFHDIGSIDDTLTEKPEDRTVSVVDVLTVNLQRLPEAIIYSEILAKPMGLREPIDIY